MPIDLEEILQKLVPRWLYEELRRDHDRLLVRLGRLEEQLLVLSEYQLDPEESTEVIDRKIHRAERNNLRRARENPPGPESPPAERTAERERPRPRPAGPERERRRDEPFKSTLDDNLAEESTEDLIRRLRMRYREITRLRERLRDEEE